MGSKFHLTLVVLGFSLLINTKATPHDPIYQQDLTGAEYTDNKLDGPPQEDQFPFYYNNNFDCTKHQYAYGMYADMDFQCQVYHVCHNNRKETFLCPQGTLFNQRLLVCDHWHSVNCQNTPSFYYVNDELGKVSNRTRFDSRDGPYSHRRLPEDYGQRSPYSPGYTSPRQGQQIPSRDRSTPSLFSQSTTEASVDSYHSRDQSRYPDRSQSGRYHPQTTDYGQPQTGQQLPSDYQSSFPGSQYDNRQQNFNYPQQKPEIGSSGSLYGNRESRFNQPGIGGTPGIQNNRDLTVTHYSQSGGVQRANQDGRTNYTWPVDRNEQRNASQGFQYGRQPPSSWRYKQNYPENSLLGSRYGGRKPSTSQYGQQLPDKLTPGYDHNQPTVSEDGQFRSQTSGLTYGNQQPSLRGQPFPHSRPPGSLYGRDQTTNLDVGQRQPEFGTPGRREPSQYGRAPQTGYTVPPRSSHHPFTTHDGQIHSQGRTPDSTFSQHSPSQYGQQPSRAQIPRTGYDRQQPPFTPQYDRPHFGASGSRFGPNEPSISQDRQQFHGRQPQSAIHYRQTQYQTTPSTPLYTHQQQTIPDSRQTGRSVYGHRQQTNQYKSQSSAQGNKTQLYNQQNASSRFQPQISGYGGEPEFGFSRQPGSGYSGRENITSGYEDRKQGSQYGTYNRPTESNTFQNQGWQQPRNAQGNQPFGTQPNIVQSKLKSQEHRSQYGRQGSSNIQGYQYSWQKPGSSQYAFRQPQYMPFSSDPARPPYAAQLTPSSSNDSSPVFSEPNGRINILGQTNVSTRERNMFRSFQSENSLNYRRNITETVPIGTQFGSVSTSSKGGQDKNLKPILVYQHHIPVTINGNTTGGAPNGTERSRQVPVYKVYYVKGDQKEPVTN